MESVGSPSESPSRRAPWSPSEDQVNHYRAVAEKDKAAKAIATAAHAVLLPAVLPPPPAKTPPKEPIVEEKTTISDVWLSFCKSTALFIGFILLAQLMHTGAFWYR